MDPREFSNSLVRRCTSWLESPRCVRSILAHHVGPVGEVRIRHLSRVLRLRRVLLLETGTASYVCHLSLNLRWIRDLDHAHRFLGERRLGVPALLGSATTPAELVRHGTGFVLLEYVEGVRCDTTSTTDTLRRVAETYAALHRVRGDRWGHPRGTPATGPAAPERPLEAWRRTIGEICALKDPADESRGETACQQLARLRLRPPEQDGYRLVHGDSNFNNILLARDGRVCLIDLENVHFGFPPIEVVHLLLQLCARDAGRWAVFLDAYLDALDAEGRRAWQEEAAFWLAGGLLARVQWYLMTYRIESAAGRTARGQWRLEVARRHGREAKRILEAAASGPFHWKDAAGKAWEEESHGARSAR